MAVRERDKLIIPDGVMVCDPTAVVQVIAGVDVKQDDYFIHSCGFGPEGDFWGIAARALEDASKGDVVRATLRNL